MQETEQTPNNLLIQQLIQSNKETSQSVKKLSESVTELVIAEKVRTDREEARRKEDIKFHEFRVESEPTIKRVAKFHKWVDDGLGNVVKVFIFALAVGGLAALGINLTS